jgi:hypothetical protein
MSRLNARSIAALVAVSAVAAGTATPVAFARHGADDPITHHRADDKGGKRGKAKAARHGADDGPGHVRHSGDDGPNHR